MYQCVKNTFWLANHSTLEIHFIGETQIFLQSVKTILIGTYEQYGFPLIFSTNQQRAWPGKTLVR